MKLQAEINVLNWLILSKRSKWRSSVMTFSLFQTAAAVSEKKKKKRKERKEKKKKGTEAQMAGLFVHSQNNDNNNSHLVKFKKRSLAKTFKKYELSAVCATAFNG